MSGGPRFPKQPLAGRDQWFVGPDGKNPFADAQAPEPPAASSPASEGNIFSPPQARLSSPAGHYEATLPHRATYVFRLGVAGLGGVVFGILVLGSILWFLLAELRNLSLIVTSAAMVVSLMAWHMGRGDLRAIRAGAMDPSGLRRTVWGTRLGMVGFLLGLAAWSTWIGSLVIFALGRR